MKKQCSKCKELKNYSEFYKHKGKPDGLRYLCKKCCHKEHKKWQENNKEKTRKSSKKYRVNNREKINLYYKSYYKKPKINLENIISIYIWKCMRKKKLNKKFSFLIGYTGQELREHIEKQFDDKMKWSNYALYWQIDHFLPLSFFKYESMEDNEFKKCWALSNLRPLEKTKNMLKGSKILFNDVLKE